MRKFFTFLLALTVGAGTIFAANGTCGDNLTWDLTDGVLTISGTGAMADYESASPAPWDAYKENVISVVINDGITTIGKRAFYNIDAMTSVTMPNSLTTIGDNAFYSCDGLTTIEIPKGITSVGYRALDNCSKLTAVVWNAKVCNYKFEYPSQIKSYTFGEEVETLSTSCCDGMSELTSIVIPNSVTSIGYRAFTGCSKLASVTIGNSVTSIGDEVFWNCTALTSIEIPNSVTSIGSWVFKGCSALSTVTIGSSITKIGEQAFYNLESLAEVTCKAVVPPTLGNECFKYASRYDLLVPAGSEDAYAKAWTQSQWKSIDAIADPYLASGTCGANLTWTLSYSGLLTISGTGAMTDWSTATAVPWAAEHAAVKAVQIADGVTTIGAYAFYKLTALIEITIPANIATIGAHAFENCTGLVTMTCDAVNPPACGTDAFAGVSSSLQVLVPVESVAKYSNAETWKDLKVTKIPIPYGTCGENLTWNYKDSVLTISGTGVMEWDGYAPWDSYYGSVKTAVIEDGAVNIDSAAFYFSMNLTSVTLPATLDSIAYLAFYACFNLKTITLPKSITKLGEGAFYYCMGLDTITCYATTPPTCGASCFYAVDTENAIVYVPNGSLEKYQNADGWKDFTNIQINPILASGTCGAEGDNLTWILNSDGLLTISGTGAMADNVDAWALYRAEIKSVAIAEGATNIGKEAFAECANLSTISIPNTVKSIGEGAFINCSSLPAITIPEGITSIKDNTFSGCAKLTGLIFPNTVTEIGKSAFAGSGLTSLVVPLFVTKIGEKGFSGCTGLTAINAQVVTPPECGANAFANVDESITLFVPEESVADYKKAKEWKDFTNVVGVDCALGSGTFGEKNEFTWKLTCSGTLLINGSGEITYSSEIPWKDYASSVKSIVISNGVTSIQGRFGGLPNLESLSLPNSLKKIANGFSSCPKLITAAIPNSVTEIELSFNTCPGLETIIFGYGVKTIHESFEGSLSKHPEIICFAVNPPGNLQNSFKDDTHYGATLYVPDASLSKYKEDIPWGYFSPILPLSSRPDTHIIASGTAGNDITWELDSNGILTIKGKGDMSSWGIPAPASVGKHYIPTDEPSAPWYPYHSDILYVVIEGGITSIGDNAFYGCTDIQSITCYATTPPACGEGAFEGIEASGLLCVPEGSESAYQSADKWNIFTEVQPIEQQPTAIDEVEAQWTNEEMRKCENTKLLINGQLYILHNGTLYGVQGQKVR